MKKDEKPKPKIVKIPDDGICFKCRKNPSTTRVITGKLEYVICRDCEELLNYEIDEALPKPKPRQRGKADE